MPIKTMIETATKAGFDRINSLRSKQTLIARKP